MFPEEKEKSPFCLINRASSGKSPWRRHHITVDNNCYNFDRQKERKAYYM